MAMESTNSYQTLQPQIAHVRRRFKLSVAISGLLLLSVEGFGSLFLLLLLDLRYETSGSLRLALLALWAAALLYLAVRHIVQPLLRRIPDEQIALLIEERSPKAEGAVISAVEFSQEGSSNRLVGALVKDAAQRVDMLPIALIATTRRLKKYALCAAALCVVSALMVVQFPSLMSQQGERIFTPWVSIQEEQIARQQALEQARVREQIRSAPIEFKVEPGHARVRRGETLAVVTQLSRQTDAKPEVKFKSKDGDWQSLPMAERDALNGFQASLQDINEALEYRIEAGRHQSQSFAIKVYDPLALKGIELVLNYPEYMGGKPETKSSKSGDITVPEGTRAEIRVLGNQALTSGKLKIDGGPVLDLAKTAGAPESVRATLDIKKDFAYALEIKSEEGEELKTAQYYVKVVPDKPPLIKITWPKMDMTVHPLCEVTMSATVSDDFGVKYAKVTGTIMHGEQEKPFEHEMQWKEKGERFAREINPKFVLSLESMKEPLQPNDMVFYNIEAGDMKGQTVKGDVFFFRVMPLEVAGIWPNSIAAADLPHNNFNKPMELMMFIAAAWALEQDRPNLPAAEFNKKSEEVAERMENTWSGAIEGVKGELANFLTKYGVGPGSGPLTPVLEVAQKKIESGYKLLKQQHEPGKAADEFRRALAIAEGSADKTLVELTLNPEPLHLGQGSEDYSSDPVMEHISIRAPSVMSDSMNVFQNMDNFPHMRPPDYRRSLSTRTLQAEKLKQLKELGMAYAAEEELVKMAEEQFGDEQTNLRAVVDGAPPQNRKGGGTKGDEEKVDFRAKPLKDLKDPAKDPEGKPLAELPDDPDENKGKKNEPGKQRRGPNHASNSVSSAKMAQKQEETAEEVKKLAKKLALGAPPSASDSSPSPNDEQGAESEAVGKLREAAAAMERSAQHFKKGENKEGLLAAKDAAKALKSAKELLGSVQTSDLNEAVAAAEEGASRITANQRQINEATEKTLTQAREKSDAPSKAGGGRNPDLRTAVQKDPALKAKTGNLGERQAANSEDVAALSKYVDELKGAAQKAGRRDVAAALGKGGEKLKTSGLEQKMVDSALDLTQGDLARARESQTETQQVLDETLAAVRQASEIMVGSKLGLVKKASRDAREIAGKASESTGGRSSGQANMEDMFSKTQNLANVLQDQELVDGATAGYLKKASATLEDFKKMFEKAKESDGQKFAAVMSEVSATLEKKLDATLEARRLSGEQREEYPPKFRKLVGKYYEALSLESMATR